MALRFCNEILEADTPLQGLRLNTLYDNIKDTIWEVYINLESGDDPTYRLATGVCIDRRGLILTSSFRINGNAVEVCNTHSGDTFTATRVGSVGDECGLALLQISGADAGFDFASIVDDAANLFAGREVYTIAHVGADELNRSLLMCGRAVSRLRRKGEVDVRIQELSEFLARSVGDDVQLLLMYGFESEVHSSKVSEEFQVPLDCAECLESLGAPVFDSRGRVIGVVVACDGGFEYAVPSRYILQMMENVSVPKHKKGKSLGQSVFAQRGETSGR